MPNNCGHCGHQVVSLKPEPGLDRIVENLLRHFDYPTEKSDTWGLKIKTSSSAMLTLRSPKGTNMLVLTLQYIDEAKSKRGFRTGWMLWDMASVYPDNLERIRKSIA